MNEWAYIILGFLGGIVFTILFIVSKIKAIAVKSINLAEKQKDKEEE